MPAYAQVCSKIFLILDTFLLSLDQCFNLDSYELINSNDFKILLFHF